MDECFRSFYYYIHECRIIIIIIIIIINKFKHLYIAFSNTDNIIIISKLMMYIT